MRLQYFLSVCFGVVLFVFVAGCGSSKPAAENPSTQPSQTVTTQTPPAEQKPANKIDTVDVASQNMNKPQYQPPPAVSPSTLPTGKFTVQVGAYKMQDNAERIAALAKERFNRNVNVVYDGTTNLYKVMVGSFDIKDDARQFRDQMVQQFPVDYKDAWVSDLTQK